MKNKSSFRIVALFAVVALLMLHSQGQDATNAPAAPAAPDASATPAASAPTDGFFFHDGDTPAVFLGDSITEQKLYTTLIETYTLSRFPSMKITFRNAGWGGDTSWLSKRGDFDAGLQRDVLALNPKAVTIDFGMNDARGGDNTYTKYLESSTKLVKGIEKVGARVVLISPSPEERYEPNAPAGSAYNVMLKKYTDGLKIVADNEKVLFIDQYTPFVGYIEAGRKAGVLATQGAPGDTNVVRLTNEGVHPNWGGHLIMATIILQGLHAPADVSSVALDAGSHSIISSQGCSVEWVNGPEGQVQFKRTDEALPWPLPTDPRIDTVLKIPGFDPIAALDRYGLKVTGLKEVAYTLSIDNVDVGVFNSADLANGINLALVHQGPIYDQEQELLKTVIAKNDAYFQRWRNVQLYELPDWLSANAAVAGIRAGEITRLDGVIADAEKEIETLRQPVPRIFRLAPVPK